MKIGLIKGRHEIVEVGGEYVFERILDVTNLVAIRRMVSRRFEELGIDSRYGNIVKLYVTGLTVALVEVINYCLENNIGLALYHYDREKGEYFLQPIPKTYGL